MKDTSLQLISDEHTRQTNGGALRPQTTLLLSMMRGRLAGATPKEKEDAKAQLIEVAAAAIALLESL